MPQLRPAATAAVTVASLPPVEASDAAIAKLNAWSGLVAGRGETSAAKIAALIATLSDWPSQTQLRMRYEQALAREQPKPDVVLAEFDEQRPITGDGALLYARALLAVSRTDDAVKFIRAVWREQDLNDGIEQTILKEFRDWLTPEDNIARVDHFLYAEKTSAALRNARLLDAPHRALVDARIAAINRSSTAAKLLDQVAPALRSEPGYIFTRAQLLRRDMKYAEAAALMLSAPTDPAVLVNPDVWSEERRELARRYLDIGDPWTAFTLVDVAQAKSQVARVEAEFEAGWYALAFLHDTAAARRHFQAILDNSSTPISRARGAFWLARTAETEGNAEEALARYEDAARYPIAFYGQLAAAKLEREELDARQPAPVDTAVAARFADRDVVQALAYLQRSGRGDEANVFYNHLAATLTDPDELTLLAGLALKQGRYPLVVQIGKVAQQRGVAIGTLPFPIGALPAYSGSVPTPVLYAIARQESEFQQAIVSSAGAVGMLQVMPEFAAEMAKRAGLAYSADRIRTDASYNMQIGAAELAYLITTYGGAYPLAFAGYNAGAGRVEQWIKAFGDPRDPGVDVVDWIERIPFGETRNYVQRAMENLGVYRALLGEPALRIEADLKGTPPAVKVARLATPTGPAQPLAIGINYVPRPAASGGNKPRTPTAPNGQPMLTDAELAARIAAVEAAQADKVAKASYRLPGGDAEPTSTE